MEIFNVIAGICSIASLVVSVFVASKVLKISNSNNDNKGEIQTGDGVRKLRKIILLLQMKERFITTTERQRFMGKLTNHQY